MKNFLSIFILFALIFITLSYEKAFIERTLAGEENIQNHPEILIGSEIIEMGSWDRDVEKGQVSPAFKNAIVDDKTMETAGQYVSRRNQQVPRSKKNTDRKILLDTAYITTFGLGHESVSFNY